MRTALLVLGFWLPLLSWGCVNYKHTGKMVVFPKIQMIAILDGLIRHDWSTAQHYEVVLDAKEWQDKNQLNTVKDVLRFYREEFVAKPKQTLQYTFFKLLRPWYGMDSEKNEGKILLIQSPYLFLGLYGIFICFREKTAYAPFFLSMIFYFWL